MQLPITTVSLKQKISLRRVLPAPGEMLVQPGQKVEPTTVVARVELPSRYRIVNVAKQLGQRDVDMSEVLEIAEGEAVQANQPIATPTGRWSLFKRPVRAPIAGVVAAIGPGWVLIEAQRNSVELPAFINGTVAHLIGSRGVVIESDGAMIEAACGFGGETVARLKRLANSPYELLSPEAIGEDVSEAIILAGRTITEELLRAAERWKVKGIIVGSIGADLLRLDPLSKVSVVATEGFGDVPMSAYTFGILTSVSRKQVSIRGQTPDLTRLPNGQLAKEPPIILATEPSKSRTPYASVTDREKITPVSAGSRVRIIQGPHLGISGTIESIPEEPQTTESGIITLGANIKINNQITFIPWANLEQVK